MHIQFAELPVFDQDRAKKFYIDHFGCEVAADAAMGKDGWRWIELKFSGAETALHFVRRNDDAPSAEPVLVLVDDDVEATVKSPEIERRGDHHRAAGGSVAAGPHGRGISRQRRQPAGDRQQMTTARRMREDMAACFTSRRMAQR
jgi:predicted enzyme related to lactoylglutathione lyase